MQKPNPLSQKIQISYVCFFGIAVILSYILSKLYFLFPHSQPITEPLIIQRNGGLDFNTLVRPKPVERFVFLSVTSIMCVAVTLFVLSVESKYLYFTKGRLFESKYVQFFVSLLIFVTLYLSLYNSEFLGSLLSIYRFGIGRPSPIITLGILVVGYALGYRASLYQLRRPSDKSTWLLWIVFLMAVLLDIVAFRIYTTNNIYLAAQMHFDAAIYALTQVINGKTLLVDLPSQYGLFPEIIAPLFKVVRASVFSVTALFAVLQIASLSALFYVLSKLTRGYWLLLLLSSLTLIVVTFSTPLFFMHIREPYFQYWPIRFFWPSMSILAFYYFSQNKSFTRAALFSVLGGVAAFWNLDSGLFIVVAFGAYFAAQFILSLSDKLKSYFWIKLLVVHLFVTLSVFSCLLYSLVLKSGMSLNLNWLIHYQKTFYQMGFMALPMPYRFNPWISILGVYLLGILMSLYSWRHRVNRISSDLIFYVSLLGIGLFTYYEGRAHTNNLIQVFWPALFVTVLITSQMLKGMELSRLSKNYHYYTAIAFSFCIISSIVFLTHLRLLVKSSYETVNEAYKPSEEQSRSILNELEFIKTHSLNNKDCIILSKYASMYYLESGIASPVKGPGLAETLLQSDLNSLEDELFRNGSQIQCVFYGIGNSETPLDINYKQLLKYYKISDKNSLGTMLYLVPKAFEAH